MDNSPQLPLRLSSERARKAHYKVRIGDFGYKILVFAIVIGVVFSGLLLIIEELAQFGYLSLALTLMMFMVAIWYKVDLKKLPPLKNEHNLDDFLSASVLVKLKNPVTPQTSFQQLLRDWQSAFVLNRLFLNPDSLAQLLDTTEAGMAPVWHKALELRAQTQSKELGAGTILTALLLTNEPVMKHCASQNIQSDDILQVQVWLERLVSYTIAEKPYFGGIGRDWATGYTPLLERFSTNISKAIERGAGHYHYLAESELQTAISNTLAQGGGAVALIGPSGSGRTSTVYAFAERLIQGRDPKLQYYQIVSLNASAIISEGAQQLEQLMLRLFGEAVNSGNMILFLDEAELFFGEGLGAFDMSQILRPVLQNRRLKIIAAFTPTDYQKLKTSHEVLTSSFSPVTLAPPDKFSTMKILEDTTLTIEHKSQVVITYDALKEAYRLSDQYIDDRSFPGKAIDLLEQSASFAENQIVSARSVQTALEKTRGVKAGGVQVGEGEVLLNLEDKIHERMINQSRAVTVVSAALRRARAGVSSPKRPIGSFLFLGPTGVGKTELARSLAGVYFGDEKQMIRLDMSEYQQESDVARLLDSASGVGLIPAIRKQPFSVVLLDEIEKAHPNILNLLLQLLDEGQLTDSTNKPASFRNAIVIATSNAGAQKIIERVSSGQPIEEFERPLIDYLIAEGLFRPELLNRFDEAVLFRPLTLEELHQVARLMIDGVNATLANQNISVQLTEPALDILVRAGYDPQFGARPMRRVIQKAVEDAVAIKILSNEATPGSTIILDVPDIKIENVKQ